MSGPIVRSGPSKTYTKNWASAFGESPAQPKAAKKPAKPAKTPAKNAKKPAAKKK